MWIGLFARPVKRACTNCVDVEGKSNPSAFAGHQKVGTSILMRPEKWLVRHAVDRIPRWIETYHLTLLTVLWSALVVGFSSLARDNGAWLMGVSAMVALQYVTDLFDGAVGRHRDTGLVKWGYFMDHFLDYVFMGALIVGYAIIAPAGMGLWFLVLLALSGGFMVTSFLSFAATNRFEVYHHGLGPTEFRVVLIGINTVLMYTGTGHFTYSVPVVCLVYLCALVPLVYRTHKQLWRIDMEAKRAADAAAVGNAPSYRLRRATSAAANPQAPARIANANVPATGTGSLTVTTAGIDISASDSESVTLQR